jgi:hypothetical protein
LEIAAVGHLGVSWLVPSKGRTLTDRDTGTVASGAPLLYPLHSLLGGMKGLKLRKACITMDTNGMMAIQPQVLDQQAGNGNPNFCGFIMCCLEDDEDDEEEHKGEDEPASSQKLYYSGRPATGWTQAPKSIIIRSSHSISF